ncbi:MAG: type II secretion system F family protein [Thermoguttaceae bacterium]
MPRYVYSAWDAQGREVSGELEAAGQADALARLSAEGLRTDATALRQIPDWVSRHERLTAEEAAELGTGVVQLAEAGLALSGGLRAMAEQSPSRRLARVLRGIAAHLDRGGSLQSAIADQGPRIPEPMRSLIAAAARSGRLAPVLEELAARDEHRRLQARHVRLALAYPAFLLGALVVLYAFFALALAPQFNRVVEDFRVTLPFATKVFLWSAWPVHLAVLVGILAILAGGVALCIAWRSRAVWAQRLLYWLPIFGPWWRDRGLADLGHLMRILTEQEIPLPQALRLAAEGLQEADLKQACRKAAAAAESGQTLSDCLTRVGGLPKRLGAVLQWGEKTPALAESFRTMAEMFDAQAQARSRLLEGLLLPIALLVVVCYLGFMFAALLLPLIHSIQSLT